MKNRVAEVNRALKKRGRPERLRANSAHHYYYFTEGNTSSWYWSSVYVGRATDLSLKEWLAEFDRLLADAIARGVDK